MRQLQRSMTQCFSPFFAIVAGERDPRSSSCSIQERYGALQGQDWERCSVQQRHGSVAGARLGGLQRLAAAQERCRGRIGSDAAAWSGTGLLQRQVWERCSVWECHRSVAGAANATVAAIRDATVFSSFCKRCGDGDPRISSCSALKRCRNAVWPQKQQLLRLGALQERYIASEAAIAASGSVAGSCVAPEAEVAAS